MTRVKQIVKQKSDLLASLEGFEPTTRCLLGILVHNFIVMK